MMRAAAAMAVLLAAAPARASEPLRIEIPEQCELFTYRDDDWANVVSVATCMQHARVACIADVSEVLPTVEQLAGELAPSMLAYVAAMEHGPVDVKLRATYHIGLTSLSLVTRLRASIAAPDLDDPAAVERARIIHARLERALEPALETARVSFGLVVQIGLADPLFADDPVHFHMIRSAAAMLVLITEREPPSHLAMPGTQPARTCRGEPPWKLSPATSTTRSRSPRSLCGTTAVAP